MEDANSTIPFLYQDIYDHIFRYVNCPRIIKNARLTNKSLLLATQNIRSLHGNISFKLLLKDNFAFPKLRHINGDIVIRYNEYYSDSCIEDKLLKLINSNHMATFGINYVYANEDDYYTDCCEDDLVLYSSISHLLVDFHISCEFSKTKHNHYKLIRNSNIIQITFIENKICVDIRRIFIPIIGYEYYLVLNNDLELFLHDNYMCDHDKINISSIIITSETEEEPIPRQIELWPSINTIIIDSQDAEYSFFFYLEETYSQIIRITTNYDLIYSKTIDDSSYRIKRLIEATRAQYHKAKIEISVFRKELPFLNEAILHSSNVILKYIDED